MAEGFIIVKCGQVDITSGSSVALAIPDISLIAPQSKQYKPAIGIFSSVDCIWRPGLVSDAADATIDGDGYFADFNRLNPGGVMPLLLPQPINYSVAFDYVHAIAVNSSGYVNYQFGYILTWGN